MGRHSTYTCDFCRKELTNKSINPDFMGYCFKQTIKDFDNDLNHSDGPYICHTCVTKILYDVENKEFTA